MMMAVSGTDKNRTSGGIFSFGFSSIAIIHSWKTQKMPTDVLISMGIFEIKRKTWISPGISGYLFLPLAGTTGIVPWNSKNN